MAMMPMELMHEKPSECEAGWLSSSGPLADCDGFLQGFKSGLTLPWINSKSAPR